jgi:hypothetical protein
MPATPETDWYERRHELDPGQVFRTQHGEIVKLDRGVPGDGTRWYVQSWLRSVSRDGRSWSDDHHWSCEDNTIEPGDLKERLPDNFGEAT